MTWTYQDSALSALSLARVSHAGPELVGTLKPVERWILVSATEGVDPDPEFNAFVLVDKTLWGFSDAVMCAANDPTPARPPFAMASVPASLSERRRQLKRYLDQKISEETQ